MTVVKVKTKIAVLLQHFLANVLEILQSAIGKKKGQKISLTGMHIKVEHDIYKNLNPKITHYIPKILSNVRIQ